MLLCVPIVLCASKYVVRAEYDGMHPLPQSISEAAKRQMEHRGRRAVMPKVKFIAPIIERDGDYWNNNAQDMLRRQLQKNTLNKNVAKNIILFLGDGMSIPTLTATRIYMGGEEKELSFEKFPFSGLSKVCVRCVCACLSYVFRFKLCLSVALENMYCVYKFMCLNEIKTILCMTAK